MNPKIFRAFLAAAVLSGSGASAQQPAQPPQHEHQMQGQDQPQAGMMEKCKAMMAEHQKMMGELQQADQRLDGMVAKMKAASGQQKTDAVAEVVSEMVSQRKAMRDRMMTMQHQMMMHMGEHMQGGQGSMAMCPMMKGMH